MMVSHRSGFGRVPYASRRPTGSWPGQYMSAARLLMTITPDPDAVFLPR